MNSETRRLWTAFFMGGRTSLGSIQQRLQRLLTILLLAAVLVPVASAQREVIHRERSLYQNITVTERGDRRCLMFNAARGDRNQTCMNTRDPKRFVFHYTRMTMAGLLLNPEPQRILIAGLGGGTLPMAFSELYPDAEIDTLEIDRAVINVAGDFFNYEETDNMETHVVDARVFVKRAGISGEKYDFIVLDAFTGDYIPEHLLTREFLEEVRAILTEDGVLVANTFSTSRLYDHESATYRAVFPEFFNFKLSGTGNRVIIARNNGLPSEAQLRATARQLQDQLSDFGVNIVSFPPQLSTETDWDTSARVLTDQFSPANLLRD